MWLLHFLPDSLIHGIILLTLYFGVGLYIIGILGNFLRFLAPYKEIIRIISTILIIVSIYFYGSYNTEMEWRKKVAEAQAKVAIAEAKSQQVNTVIETKIVNQTKVIHDKQIVIQHEIQTVEKQIDSECKLDPVVIKIVNEAAENPNGVKK